MSAEEENTVEIFPNFDDHAHVDAVVGKNAFFDENIIVGHVTEGNKTIEKFVLFVCDGKKTGDNHDFCEKGSNIFIIFVNEIVAIIYLWPLNFENQTIRNYRELQKGTTCSTKLHINLCNFGLNIFLFLEIDNDLSKKFLMSLIYRLYG